MSNVIFKKIASQHRRATNFHMNILMTYDMWRYEWPCGS